MRKRLIALAAVLLAVSVPVSADAETFTGGDDWRVSFNGEEMVSTFTNANIEDTIYLMQPGDIADIHLRLSNDYTVTTDWYMTNQVLQSLEDSQSVAEGGAYTYILTYTGPDGAQEVLYSSDEVGGETVNESGEGLYQATDSLEDYFFLDSLAAGEAGEINLRVQLEGETQGNEYQDTLARLQMNFAVELPADTPGDSDTPDDEKTPENEKTPVKTRVAKTGDNSQVIFWAVLSLALGLLCLALAVCQMVRYRRADADESMDFTVGREPDTDRKQKRRGKRRGR